MQKRVSWIDWAKVICIWLMVSCHAGQKGMLLDLTYQFHMPAFMIISGLLFRPKGVLKELKSFGFPIVCFGVITQAYHLAIDMFKGNDNIEFSCRALFIIKSSLTSLFMESPISWFQGYWFVVTLLFLRLLMENKVVREQKLFIGVASMIWCCVEPMLDIPEQIIGMKFYHVLSCLPFFVIGMLVNEKKIDVTKGCLELKLVSFVLFAILTFIQGRVDLGGYNYGLNYIVMFVNAICGSWLLFGICALFPYRKYIQDLSTGTFLILGLHGIMYGYIIKASHLVLGTNIYYTPLLVGVSALCLLYPLIRWCITHTPILLGKVH